MEKSVFETLFEVNVNDHVEKKNGLSYLSWPYAWAEVKKRFQMQIIKFMKRGIRRFFREKSRHKKTYGADFDSAPFTPPHLNDSKGFAFWKPRFKQI